MPHTSTQTNALPSSNLPAFQAPTTSLSRSVVELTLQPIASFSWLIVLSGRNPERPRHQMTSPHAARRSPWLAALALLLLVVNACTIPYQQNDWAAYDGLGQQYFQAEELGFSFDLMDDPLEPINRPISVFNYGLLYGIVQPVAWGYREVLPEGGREAIGNLFSNWLYPARLVNNLLKAQWDGAGRETQRFLINTTVGMFGLFDPAENSWEIESSHEDMGHTFHDWGWRNSTYFVMPVLGPTTIRDGFGQIGDYSLDPLTYTSQPQGLYAQYFRTFNALSGAIPGVVAFVEQNYDPYQLSKLLFIFNREIQTEDYSTQSEDSGDTETLASIFFRPEDPDWDTQGETHTLPLSNGRKITYTVWMQDKPAPLFYFIPGTGGHRLDNSALAVSELTYNNGRHHSRHAGSPRSGGAQDPASVVSPQHVLSRVLHVLVHGVSLRLRVALLRQPPRRHQLRRRGRRDVAECLRPAFHRGATQRSRRHPLRDQSQPSAAVPRRSAVDQ
ncbi:MAG: phospholipid-binding lipoprotein MlaA [Pseudohongiellaceae bacterium]|jgi:phospholipid-binding lipoprotein MlaA